MKREIITTTKHRVLLAAMPVLAVLTLCQFVGVTQMRASPVFLDPSMPQFTDFLVCVPIAIVLGTIKVAWSKTALARSALPPHRRESAFHIDASTSSSFMVPYFLAMTCFGFYTMKDETWFPVALGGSGDMQETMRLFNRPPPATLKLYVLIEFAFWLQSFVLVLLQKDMHGDIFESLVHDVLAMQLIAMAYMANYPAAAAIVVFMNQASDIFLHSFLVAANSERKTPVAWTLALHVASTLYLRLFIFPTESLYRYMVVLAEENPDVPMSYLQPLNFLSTMLVVLHAYWLVLFIQKGLRVINRSTNEDTGAPPTDTHYTAKKAATM